MAEIASDLTLDSGLCLVLIRNGSDHGYVIAQRFLPDADIGQIYTLSRPAVYRELQFLERAGWVLSSAGRGNRGQKMRVLRLSKRGAQLANEWLASPVAHIRDVRTEFLTKTVLAQEAGGDVSKLIRQQREFFRPTFEALLQERDESVVAMWRREQVRAVSRFLDELEGVVSASDDDGEDDDIMVSARNQLRGEVVSVKHGGVLSSVKMEIAPGQIMTATITREATDQLRLAPGSPVTALCKATDVMLAVGPGTRSQMSRRA
jgi:PadR family transcriptional regulator AphA